MLSRILPQEGEQFLPACDRRVDDRIIAGPICSHQDQIAIFLISRPKLAKGRSGTAMLIRDHIRHHAAERLADIDRRENALFRKLPGKDDMAIHNGAGRIHDGIIRVVAIRQNGVERRDRSARAAVHTRTLDKTRNERQGRGRIALHRGRLAKRQADPLSHWKVSPIDAAALKHWDAYSEARDAMLAQTHHPAGPWTVVCADDKRATRLNVLRDLLSRSAYHGKDEALVRPDRAIVFPYEAAAHAQGMIAP